MADTAQALSAEEIKEIKINSEFTWFLAQRDHNNFPIERREVLARLLACAELHAEMLAALKASEGYLLNAKIDLETGAPKRTAIATIDGGLKVVRAAIQKAGG